MFGECHAHMLMDGIDYREAVKLHRESVCESKSGNILRLTEEQGFLLYVTEEITAEFPEEPHRLPENMGSIIGHRFLLSIKKDIMAGLSDEALAI